MMQTLFSVRELVSVTQCYEMSDIFASPFTANPYFSFTELFASTDALTTSKSLQKPYIRILSHSEFKPYIVLNVYCTGQS